MLNSNEYKLSIIGVPNVGKSNIARRFLGMEFKESYRISQGIDVGVKSVGEENNERFHVWDIPGTEAVANKFIRYYLKNSHIVLLVYSVTDKNSFDCITRSLYQAAYKHVEENTVFMLIGNKSDDKAARAVTKEQAEAFADKNDMLFAEVSAKNNEGIERVFSTVTQKVLTRISMERLLAIHSLQLSSKAIASGDTLIKIFLAGNSGVGKSQLLNRMAYNAFDEKHCISHQTSFQEFNCNTNADIKFQCWDPAVDPKLSVPFMEGTDIFVLIYDVMDTASFEAINGWYELAIKKAGDKCIFVLVGNKSKTDESRRMVTTEMGRQFANSHNMIFFEISAKLGSNVDSMLLKASNRYLNAHPSLQEDNETDIVELYSKQGGGMFKCAYFHGLRFFCGKSAVEEKIRAKAQYQKDHDKTGASLNTVVVLDERSVIKMDCM